MFFSAKRIIATLSVAVLAGLASAGEQVYFQSNFAENKTLKGWNDIWDQRGTRPVRKDLYKVVTENGESYFRSEKNANGKLLPLWGIWHTLGKRDSLLSSSFHFFYFFFSVSSLPSPPIPSYPPHSVLFSFPE